MESHDGRGLVHDVDAPGIPQSLTFEQALGMVRESEDREGVLRALLRSGTEEARRVILALSLEDDVALRRLGAFFLGLIESPQVVSRLTELLRDDDPHVRANAYNSLLDQSSADVAKAVTPLVADPSKQVAGMAIDILGALAESQGPLAVSRYRIDVEPLVDALIKALGEPDERIQAEAARALAKAGPRASRSVPSLAEVLTGPFHRARFQAVAALRAIDTDASRILLREVALPKLVEDIEHPDPRVGAGAAEAARHVGPEAIPALVEASKTANDTVRFAISLSLRQMGDQTPSAVAALTPMLYDGDLGVRRNAARTLQDIGTADALEAVRTVEEDINEDPEEKMLRMMEAWARRSATTRVRGYQLIDGHLRRIDGKRLSFPMDEKVGLFVEKALNELGERISRQTAWDITLEEEASMAGLLLKPSRSDVRTSVSGCASCDSNLEIVFDRSSLQILLVIGAGD